MSGTLQSEPSIAGSPYFGKWLGHAVVFIAFWSGTAGAAIAYGAIKGWNLPLFIVVAAAVVFLALLGRALVRTFNSGRSVVYWFGNR
ncbi:MAG: hypothetical protein HY433_01015 [Candidatus Liptonbacteria bacterium]|nr:hypothetical protein [Candidatus Liptonbacteria bacterium]